MQRKTNCRRRWLYQLDVTRLPTTIEQLPTVRYLCYNTATGQAYAELSDSRTKVHMQAVRPAAFCSSEADAPRT